MVLLADLGEIRQYFINNRSSMRNAKDKSVMTKAAEKAVKKLEEYKKTVPEQLSLFFIEEQKDQQYSNAIALYDALPKYFWGKYQNQFQDGKVTPVVRGFVHEGVDYRLTVSPAFIQRRDGTWDTVMPTEREEIVEDALRKLAVEGRAVFLDDHAGVVFTLYEIRKELAARGRTLNNDQIKEALLVCSKAHIEVKTDDGRSVLSAPLFTTVGLQTMDDWREHGQRSRAFVQFNPLVTRAIRTGAYRQINYETAMAYSSALARWFHKRLTLRYRQASADKPYSIRHSSVVRDSGMATYQRDRKAIERVKAALQEMVDRGALSGFTAANELDATDGRKVADVHYTLTPSPDFIKETIRANFKEGEVRRGLIKGDE